jgi:hypothetical protein
MKLFEIHDEIEQVLAAGTDRETGEISEQCLVALDDLEIQRTEKALSVAAYLKGEQAEAEAIKAQADKLVARAKVHERRAEWLLSYLERHVEEGTKISDSRSEIGWRESAAANVPNVDALEAKYVREKTTREPDKKRILAELREGGEVAGAYLEKRKKLYVK